MRTTLLAFATLTTACAAPYDLAPAPDDRGLITLARFDTSYGSAIEFVLSPDIGDVGYLESIDAGPNEQSMFDREPELSVLERYLRLASSDAAVPAALVELSRTDQAARVWDRELVDSIPGTVFVAADMPDSLSATSGSGSCGSNGGNYFREHHCDLTGSARFDPIRACDNSYNGGNTVWFSLTRSTGSSRRWSSHARVAACTSSGAVTDHQYRTIGGNWKTSHHVHIDPYKVTYSTWNGGSKRRRKVRSKRNGNTGGIRSYTVFKNLQ